MLIASITLLCFEGMSLNTVVAAKKKRPKSKKSEIEYPEVGSHKRASDISPDLHCGTCMIIVEWALENL